MNIIMKISITIIALLFLLSLIDKNQENMKIVEYSVDELNDKKLFMIIDSLNVVSANNVGCHILIYRYEYESSSSEIFYFPNDKTNNKIEYYKSEYFTNFSILCDSLEKEYHNKVFERICFVEDGGIEYFVLLRNSKIVSCFISDGFFWNLSNSDKRLKTFNDIYPKIIEMNGKI